MRLHATAVVALSLVLSWAPRLVEAHVSPAVEENNRYIKLTPMGDRVQLAYVVFLGEIPGKQARAEDGFEARAYADALAERVAAKLELTIDGEPRPIVWDQVANDLEPSPDHKNALSISLIAWLCLSEKSPHRIGLHDRFEFPPPGETALTVEPGPGIEGVRSVLGESSQLKFEWVGMPNPMDEHGYLLEFSVAPDRAVYIGDSRCTPAKPPAAHSARGERLERVRIAVLVAAVLAALGGVALVLRRLRSRT